MRKLEAVSNTQDITNSQLCHAFTADRDRLIFMRVFAAGVAGGGDYLAYVTIQRSGEGAEYTIVPLTVTPVDSGAGAICLTTVPLPLYGSDVARVYLRGVAQDDAAAVTVEVWEDDSNFYFPAPGDFPTGTLGNALARLGTSPTIRIEVPVMDTNRLEIVRGDDYAADHARGITLSNEQWPDLTDATVQFQTLVLSVACTVTGPRQVLLELTKAQTGLLSSGYFSLVAAFSDGDEVSLVPKAKLSVIDRVT